jgi:alanine racemase
MTINLRALKYNLERVHALAPHSRVMAMVKANGYGHGLSAVGMALSEADALGVASLEEGMILRAAGILEQPIVLMEGLFHQNELLDAEHHNFTLVVHHLAHVKMLGPAKVKKPFNVWLKINTGMHRLGVGPSEFTDIYQRLLAIDAVQKPIGLMTHFAEADDRESDATPKQIEVFNRTLKSLKGPRSLANSAGILAWKDAHCDWVRPGLLLYGASPFPNQTGVDHGLQPVMTLWSRLIAITHVKRGGKVGYGGTWMAPEDMNVGVVGVGYGDGYPQSAKAGTPVLVNGVLCELVGRVSMDMLTVDLRNNPHAQIGDRVVLWGEGLPVEKVAASCRSSAYEVLTRMTPRPKIQFSVHP